MVGWTALILSMLALSKKKKERNNNVSQVTRNNVFWWFLAAVILFLGFCCSSQGQISLSNRDNIFMRRTLHQVGSDVFLEPLEHVTRKQTNDSEVLIIPLAYRVPLGPEDIWKNILASESRKTHLLGKNRKSLARQLEQAFQVGNNVWEDELHFPVKDNPIRVQRYFEQVILGNVVNSK